MHFFNPVDRMQLVEVISGEKTSDATVATLVALARKIGKTPIVLLFRPEHVGFVLTKNPRNFTNREVSGGLIFGNLLVLSLLVFLTLRAPLGAAGALTAFTPLALFFAVRNPGTAWLLTKAYFGVVWLYLLGISGAAG